MLISLILFVNQKVGPSGWHEQVGLSLALEEM
jgi:hypothetical protein